MATVRSRFLDSALEKTLLAVVSTLAGRATFIIKSVISFWNWAVMISRLRRIYPNATSRAIFPMRFSKILII